MRVQKAFFGPLPLVLVAAVVEEGCVSSAVKEDVGMADQVLCHAVDGQKREWSGRDDTRTRSDRSRFIQGRLELRCAVK